MYFSLTYLDNKLSLKAGIGEKVNMFPAMKLGEYAILVSPKLVKVPFILEDVPNNKSYKMEFWGGFVGLSQNKADFTLKPEIGWCINNVNTFDPKKSKFSYETEMDDLSVSNIDSVPEDIYSLKKIGFLHLNFLPFLEYLSISPHFEHFLEVFLGSTFVTWTPSDSAFMFKRLKICV